MTNLFPTANNSNRIEDTANKIRSFRQLPSGWHFGEGSPPTDAIVDSALALNCEAGIIGFAKTNAFPGTDGEIQVTIYHASIYLELTIEVDGTITFVHEEADREIEYEEGLSIGEALQRIRSIKGLVWHSFGSFITGTMTQKRGGLIASPSSTPVMAAESQWLTGPASKEAASPFVNISQDSIKTSPAYRPFIGKFLNSPFLKVTSSSS